MKFVFIFTHIGFFRHYENVIRCLYNSGHTIRLLFGFDPAEKFSDRGVKTFLAEHNDCDFYWTKRRQDRWVKLLTTSREMINYQLYLNPKHPSPQIGIRRRERLPRIFRSLARSKVGKKMFASAFAHYLLRRVENYAPPDKEISQWIASEQPD